jgi:hypothetical protein
MRTGVVVAAVLSACVVAAGCGGEEAVAPVAGEPIALEQISRSASTSAEAASSRFAFDLSVSLPGAEEAFSFSGEGAFDRASERSSFAVDMSSFAKLLGGFFAALAGPRTGDGPDFDDPSGWKIEVVQDGPVSYLRFPAIGEKLPEGKTWIRGDGRRVEVDGFEFSQLEDAASADPRELLEMLKAAGGDVETVGVEELRGTETTHYRATIDPARYAETAASGARAGLEVLGQPLPAGVGDVPVDVWLDGNGLVRKVSLNVSAEDQGQGAGSASMTFELWDYGEDVEIELPPADEVVDASALRS